MSKHDNPQASPMVDILRIPQMHRNIYRGKYLGGAVTAAQYAAIANQTWDDLFIGDYWTIGAVDYVIADINLYHNIGDTGSQTTTPHLVMIPRRSLYQHRMNASTTTATGYTNSEMYTTGLTQAKQMIEAAFGAEHILSHRLYLCTKAENGIPTGWAYTSSTVDLPTQIEILGCRPQFAGDTSVYGYDDPGVRQLALMRLDPRYITWERDIYGLRDVACASNFATIYNVGNCIKTFGGSAQQPRGVRPVFCIKA